MSAAMSSNIACWRNTAWSICNNCTLLSKPRLEAMALSSLRSLLCLLPSAKAAMTAKVMMAWFSVSLMRDSPVVARYRCLRQMGQLGQSSSIKLGKGGNEAACKPVFGFNALGNVAGQLGW